MTRVGESMERAVAILAPHLKVGEALEVLARGRQQYGAVTRGKAVAGIVCVRELERMDATLPIRACLKEIAVVSIGADDAMTLALELMELAGVDRLAVIDVGGDLRGVVTRPAQGITP